MTQSRVFFTVLALMAFVTSVAGEAECLHHSGYTMLRADCANRNLTTVPYNLMPKIEILDLSSNHIRQLDDNSFSCCSSIKLLYLRYNEIAHIAPHAFNHLSSLHVLDFEGSQLRELPKNLPTSLASLGIDSNSYLFKDYPTSPVLKIASLTSLTELKIGFNELRAFPRFDGVIPSLAVLKIDYNPLRVITPEDLAPLCGLKFLSAINVPFKAWYFDCDCLRFQKWAFDFNISVTPEINCLPINEKPWECNLEHRKDTLQVREKCLSELSARKSPYKSPISSDTTIVAQSDENLSSHSIIGHYSLIVTAAFLLNVCCILLAISLYFRHQRRKREQLKTVGAQNSDFLSVKYDHKAAEEKMLAL